MCLISFALRTPSSVDLSSFSSTTSSSPVLASLLLISLSWAWCSFWVAPLSWAVPPCTVVQAVYSNQSGLTTQPVLGRPEQAPFCGLVWSVLETSFYLLHSLKCPSWSPSSFLQTLCSWNRRQDPSHWLFCYLTWECSFLHRKFCRKVTELPVEPHCKVRKILFASLSCSAFAAWWFSSSPTPLPPTYTWESRQGSLRRGHRPLPPAYNSVRAQVFHD